HGAGGGRNGPSGFSYWLLQFGKGYPLPTVVHLHGSILPFADQRLALRGPTSSLSTLPLQIATVVEPHPVIADRAFGLQPEDLTQLWGGRLPPVIILRRGRRPGKAS